MSCLSKAVTVYILRGPNARQNGSGTPTSRSPMQAHRIALLDWNSGPSNKVLQPTSSIVGSWVAVADHGVDEDDCERADLTALCRLWVINIALATGVRYFLESNVSVDSHDNMAEDNG